MKIMLQDVLKEMREKARLKQSEVAEYVGVTPQTYMKWENGKNEPKASNLKKLAEILNVSEVELCRGERFAQEDDPL
ncbi:helix-turn-helix transcriptional regulator, partial [Vibrio vulnificus]